MINSLSVHIKQIVDEGLSLECEFHPDELALKESDARVKGPLHLKATLVKTPEGAGAYGKVRGILIQECVRCLEEFETPLDLVVSGSYQHEQQEVRYPPGEKNDEKPEEDPYPIVANQVDLAPMLREHVILALPMQPLCHVNCSGLCSQCGQDLNQATCSCGKDQGLSPFSALRDLVKARENMNP